MVYKPMQETASSKITSLHDVQEKAGATFASFDGWEVPRTYGNTSKEYRAARQGAALLDRSAFGRLRISGADALDLLNRLSTNKVIDLAAGEGASTVLTTNKGRIIDLLPIINLSDELLVITSPQTVQNVVDWIDLYTFGEDIQVRDVTEETALLSIIGPDAGALLGPDAATLNLYGAREVSLEGVQAHVVRTDALGTTGYDLLVTKSQAEEAWDALLQIGAVPMGEDAAEMLRVEQGAPRYGRELSEEFNPLEAGLLPSISFDKGCYIGQEVVVRLNTYDKVQKHLVGIAVTEGSALPEQRLEVDGKDAGLLTSVAHSPILESALALGYVRTRHASVGQEVDIRNGDGHSRGRIVALPIDQTT